MKLLQPITLLLLSAVSLFSQTVTIPGYLSLQNSGGRSAFPLELSVSNGAKITKSDPATGYFEVTCPTSGDYFLDVRKAGYEVVNPRAAHLYFFKNKANTDTLRLALNREGAWLDLADRYYRAGMTSITRTHEARLAELKNNTANPDVSNTAYRTALDSLANQAFRAFTFTDLVAERLAQTDNDRCSAAYRAAIRLFVEGDAAAALDALKSASTSSERMLRARLFVFTLKEQNARAEYEAACAAAPDNYQLTREYVYYLLNFPDLIDLGQAVWEKKIATARHDNDRAIALFAIGSALGRKNKVPEALEYYHKAAEIREPLAAANPFFSADYAVTCQALGTTYLRGNNTQAANIWIEKAQEAWNKSANACAFSYCDGLPAIKKIWIEASIQGNVPAYAEKILQDGAMYFDRLAEHYSANGYLNKTNVLRMIADIRLNSGDRAGASAVYREITSIFEEYEEDWPLWIESRRGNLWIPMALAASSTPPMADERLLSKGIERLRAAASIAPGTFEIPLAECLNLYGRDQLIAGNETDGFRSLEEARLLAERYREQQPTKAVLTLAKIFNNFANYIANNVKDYQKAIEYYDKTIEAYQGCETCNKNQKYSYLRYAHASSGKIWINLEQPLKAIERYSEAAKNQRYLLEGSPTPDDVIIMLHILSEITIVQVSIAITNGDLPSKDAALKTIAEAEELLAKYPNLPNITGIQDSFQQIKDSLKN